MKKDYFFDLPGVGEIELYTDTKNGKTKKYVKSLAFKTLHSSDYATEVQSLGGDNKSRIKKGLESIPFIDVEGRRVGFVSEKYQIAATLLSVFETLNDNSDLPILDNLMPYDHIRYFRDYIEADDATQIIESIENSKNNHYIRFLFLLLRRCADEGNTSWKDWVKNYVKSLPEEIDSYSEYTVQRDARVTYAALEGKSELFGFVERLFSNRDLSEYEKRHFIESLGSPERAGDVLYQKVIQTGYRQRIAPTNVHSLRFFPLDHNIRLLKDVSDEHENDEMRTIAKRALGRART